VPAATPSAGLARITIRAPRRRLDLAVPDQVPVAEFLSDVLRRAGEGAAETDPLGQVSPGGWALRRADGSPLQGETALAHQGVRDGDVLYLVPRSVTWPEPDYDDLVEEIANSARKHGRSWDATATRLFALSAAGFVLMAGVAVLLAAGPQWMVPGAVALGIAGVLLFAGALLSRGVGDGVAGAASGGFALPYAAAGGVMVLAGNLHSLRDIGVPQLLVGATSLLLASVIGAVAVGHGLRVFAAGVTAGLFATIGALLGLKMSAAGAASILTVVLVAGIGLAPLLAVRLGKLPLPVVTSTTDPLSIEPHPARPEILAAVVRADEVLSGVLLGIAVLVTGCILILATSTGWSGPLLAGLASLALLLRARLFPTVAARLPLLIAGLAGIGLTGTAELTAAASGSVRLFGVAAAFVAVVILLATATAAYRRRPRSPYLARLGDILDVAAVVSLAPVACAVLGLYGRIRGLAG
jgi:type VII secretion integral membrane protein EccD